MAKRTTKIDDLRIIQDAFVRARFEMERLATILETNRPDKAAEIRGALGTIKEWWDEIKRAGEVK